jgi:hypothetical protein
MAPGFPMGIYLDLSELSAILFSLFLARRLSSGTVRAEILSLDVKEPPLGC